MISIFVKAVVCSRGLFLQTQKNWFCSVLFNNFPHKCESLSKEVVKSWRRSVSKKRKNQSGSTLKVLRVYWFKRLVTQIPQASACIDTQNLHVDSCHHHFRWKIVFSPLEPIVFLKSFSCTRTSSFSPYIHVYFVLHEIPCHQSQGNNNEWVSGSGLLES